MISVHIDRVPPAGLDKLGIGEPVLLILDDVCCVAYLTGRQVLHSTPILIADGKCAVLYGGLLLSFAFEVPKHPDWGPWPGTPPYEPPIYSCVVPVA